MLNRQAAHPVHFISFCWFVLFILAHGIMVFVTGLPQNTNHMFAGMQSHASAGFPLFVSAMALVGLAWWIASPFKIRHARLVQQTGRFMVGWIKGLSKMVGAECPAHGTGHLTAFLAQRHDAELRRVRGAGG